MHQEPRFFRLIALSVLEGCSPKLRKVLHEGETYFFCNDYEDNHKGGIRKKTGARELSADFFQVKNSPLVGISCVVGMNGDGKSSIIELLIRTLNNFAYAAGFKVDHKSLCFIPGLYTKLFYKVDANICAIVCKGEKIELIENEINLWEHTLNSDSARRPWLQKKKVVKYTQDLFYTIVNNYSLYAYNSEEFKYETGDDVNEVNSWINALFHKNDAYQTPIVLSPMRTRGNININREYELSMQRFNELFLDCKEGKFRIGEHEIVEGFVAKVETECKLYTRTIKGYIIDPKLGARNVIILDYSFRKNRERHNYALNLVEKKVLDDNILFWKGFDERFYDSGLLSIAKTIITKENTALQPTDLSEYLNRMRNETRERRQKLSNQKIRNFIRHGGGRLTFLQFQRIYLIYEIYQRWCYRYPQAIKFGSVQFRDMSLLNHAVWYLIYKTIRVIEQYPDFFSGGLDDYECPQHFFNESVRQNNLDKWFRAIDEDILDYKTHISLKIRQTLEYITNYYESILTNKFNQMASNHMPNAILAQHGFDIYVDSMDYYNKIDHNSEFAASVPPPIFYLDYVISRNNNELYPFSKMSSGERQLLNTASAITYHLKNIDRSKNTSSKIVYKNICVILEEVELYFHPEYQRQFVNYLLTQIANANLKRDIAINLVFVTHSPFILSDVPKQNVLFLKNGAPDRSMQEDTFAANIHTLLQNGFFLNSVPIGDFAKGKLNHMFAQLNQSSVIGDEEMDKLFNEIPLVSEPLLRGQLMKLYQERRNFEGRRHEDYAAKIHELEQTIHELKKKLNDHH